LRAPATNRNCSAHDQLRGHQAHGGKRAVGRLRKAYEAAWARLRHHQPGYAQLPEDAALAADLRAWMIFREAMLIGEVIL
jgi:DNA helicase-2/ATP-dependent DNA helicase PcrA